MFGVGLVGLSGMAVVGVVQTLRVESAPCTGAADKIEEVWDETRRATVHRAFDATGVPYAGHAWGQVDKALGEYTASWSEHHVAICEATNVRQEQSAALMDVLECPAPNVSYALSAHFKNADKPFFCRIVPIRSRRPVTILCG